MYRTPDGELTWGQFKSLPHIHRLPLHEQSKHYNSYLDNLASERMQFENWIQNQNKGNRKIVPRPIVETGVLLQENLFDLEQEDGNKILITSYA